MPFFWSVLEGSFRSGLFAGLWVVAFHSATAWADSFFDGRAASEQVGISDQGYRAHAALGFGIGALSDSAFDGLPSGQQFLGALSIGRRTRRGEWDTSLGWGFWRRNGVGRDGRAVAIQIRSARWDVSPRLRLGERWSLGPVLAVNFGTDTSYRPVEGGARFTPYLGARTTMDMRVAGGLSLQLWAEAITQMSLASRDLLSAMVGLRVGLPVTFRRTSDWLSTQQAAPYRALTHDLKEVSDVSRIHFAIDSAEVSAESRETLSRLADTLRDSSKSWNSIEINGHSDLRGPWGYNQSLSLQRALSVRQLFVQAGVPADRIEVAAFGATRPQDRGQGARAHAQNRRVEIVIISSKMRGHDERSPE
jgi:outer membrane protein OmpA-like peptidoglycan-associated protein